MKKLIITLLASILILVGCDEDDSNPTTPKQSATFKVTIENVSKEFMFSSYGIFNTASGASSPGPLLPGNKYEFEFDAAPGHKLSFATMFVHSNDFFYSPDENGIDLYDISGNPITGDITSQILLWDAGTEIDQEPGLGSDQAPSQAGSNTGADDADIKVRLAADSFNNLPSVSDVVRVTLTNENETHFKLSIENISTDATLSNSDGGTKSIPLAPGVWAVHTDSSPLFSPNQENGNNGLEALAEDGDPSVLGDYLSMNSGLVSPFAPGVYAIHNSSVQLFVSGQQDNNLGIEELAEDGDPSVLNTSITGLEGISTNGIFNTPSGSSGPGPILPGNSYEFTFTAESDQKLSFATMLVQSNDLFVGTDDMGLDLFDNNEMPISGDITSFMSLWDAGTEVNEKPGIGLNQPIRQNGPNTGNDENGSVRVLNDGFTYPSIDDLLRVTIELQ